MNCLIPRKLVAAFLSSLILSAAAAACTPESQLGEKLDQEQALQLVLEEVIQPDQLGDDMLVVFAWPEPLVPGDLLYPYNALAEDPIPGLITIESESWFFWIEDEPFAQFAHPTRFILVETGDGNISSSEEQWWPILNGQGLWTDPKVYQNEDNWAWSSVSFKENADHTRFGASSVLAAVPAVRPAISDPEAGERRALVINTVTETQLGEDNSVEDAENMLHILEKNEFKTTYLGTVYDENPKRSGTPFSPGNKGGADPWEEELRKQAGELKAGDTLVVYIAGHGNASRLGGGYITNENGELMSFELERELKGFEPGVDVIVILQGCHTGAWIDDLKDVADLTLTATDAETSSYGDMDFVASWISPLFLTDLNPLDIGSEYTSSLVAGWEEILDDPALLEKVRQRAKVEGISFMQALISEAYEQGSVYDLASRLHLSYPQISYGNKQPTPTPSPTPTSTSTPEPSPTSAYGYTLGDYRVSMTVIRDPSGHKGFIKMPGTLNLTLREGSLVIDGPFPFVAVKGEVGSDGLIAASGRGTVAGYPNISVSFQGSVSSGRLEGEYTMGANGGLPGGRAIVYGVSGDRLEPTATPTPDPRIGELGTFFDVYNARFLAEDIDGLISMLHPAVLGLYGEGACRAYLAGVIKNPVEITLLELLSEAPWTWEIDGQATLIEASYSVQVEVSAGGQTKQQTMHLGLSGDGSVAWFTDCGDPIQ